MKAIEVGISLLSLAALIWSMDVLGWPVQVQIFGAGCFVLLELRMNPVLFCERRKK